MLVTNAHSLQLVRTFTAAPEKVYAAWTSPDAIKLFFLPGEGFSIDRVEIDVRAGGNYTIVMKGPDGGLHTAVGIFREVVPNKKLVYTWSRPLGSANCAGTDGGAGLKETLVTMEFRAKGSGTELAFTHDLFPDDASRTAHERGWSAILDRLVSYCA